MPSILPPPILFAVEMNKRCSTLRATNLLFLVKAVALSSEEVLQSQWMCQHMTTG